MKTIVVNIMVNENTKIKNQKKPKKNQKKAKRSFFCQPKSVSPRDTSPLVQGIHHSQSKGYITIRQRDTSPLDKGIHISSPRDNNPVYKGFFNVSKEKLREAYWEEGSVILLCNGQWYRLQETKEDIRYKDIIGCGKWRENIEVFPVALDWEEEVREEPEYVSVYESYESGEESVEESVEEEGSQGIDI